MSAESLFHEALPYAANMAALGAVGAAIEATAKTHISHNQDQFVGVHGPIIERQQQGRLRRLAGFTLVVGLGLGAMVSVGWGSGNSVHQAPRRVEIIIDHSGATILGNGASTPADSITTVANTFNDSDVDAEAYIASAGGFAVTTLDQVATDKPIGEAPLFAATKNALDNSGLNGDKSKSQTKRKSSGIVILTNHNLVDPQDQIINEAKTDKVPVFVVNVGADETSKSTKTKLQTIANKTGGEYWDANGQNINQVKDVVKETLVPQQVRAKDGNPWKKRAALYAMSLGMLGYAGIYRRRMPTGNTIKGKK